MSQKKEDMWEYISYIIYLILIYLETIPYWTIKKHLCLISRHGKLIGIQIHCSQTELKFTRSLSLILLGASEGVKEKLVPLIQGPSDTKDLYMSRWLNEIRKPESLLAPDLLVFSVQVPQQGDDCRHSGKHLSNLWKGFLSLFSSSHLLSHCITSD